MAPEDYDRDTRHMVESLKGDFHREMSEVKGELRASISKIEKIVHDHLIYRLPTWVTVVFGILTAALGVLAGLKL